MGLRKCKNFKYFKSLREGNYSWLKVEVEIIWGFGIKFEIWLSKREGNLGI